MPRVWSLRVSVVLAGLVLAACDGPPQQGIARGKDLYDTCLPCHGSDGAGKQALGAPSIGGLPAWYVEAQLKTFQAGHRGYDAFDTVGIRMKSMAWSLDLGRANARSPRMWRACCVRRRGWQVSGDAQAGQASFALCATCHGADGAATRPCMPPLAHQHDWYLLAQLEVPGRMAGTSTGDVWGAAMRPNAMLLDAAAMHNVVAYIQTLK
jgi:cytochrome c oxidase subunit 2